MMAKNRSALILSIILLLISFLPSSAIAESGEAEHDHETHWSYKGEGAPEHWGELKAEFETCKTGKSQSPIDIAAMQITKFPPRDFYYKESPLNIINNGHTIQVNYDKGSSIVVGGKKFNLLQFHFHSPSEHTVGGKAYEMVAHIVHKAEDGQLGVIGVSMIIGEENDLIQNIWDNLPEHEGEARTVNDIKINVSELLPGNKAYFNYSGSLTTPPCSEGVNWMFFAFPVEVSAGQVEKFTSIFELSVRPVQPLNGRVVKMGH